MRNLTQKDFEELYSHENLVKIYNWKTEGRYEEITNFVKDFTDAKVMSSNLRGLINDLVSTAFERINVETNEIDDENDQDENVEEKQNELYEHRLWVRDTMLESIYGKVDKDEYISIYNLINYYYLTKP